MPYFLRPLGIIKFIAVHYAIISEICRKNASIHGCQPMANKFEMNKTAVPPITKALPGM
jgi:hypothetical protein